MVFRTIKPTALICALLGLTAWNSCGKMHNTASITCDCNNWNELAIKDYSMGNTLLYYDEVDLEGIQSRRFEEFWADSGVMALPSSFQYVSCKDSCYKIVMDSLLNKTTNSLNLKEAIKQIHLIDSIIPVEMNNDGETIYTVAKRPEYPGGERALNLITTLYSSDVKQSQKLIYWVKIDTNGKIYDHKIVWRYTKYWNDSTENVLNKLEAFEPAQHFKSIPFNRINPDLKKVPYRMEIVFRILPK